MSSGLLEARFYRVERVEGYVDGESGGGSGLGRAVLSGCIIRSKSRCIGALRNMDVDKVGDYTRRDRVQGDETRAPDASSAIGSRDAMRPERRGLLGLSPVQHNSSPGKNKESMPCRVEISYSRRAGTVTWKLLC